MTRLLLILSPLVLIWVPSFAQDESTFKTLTDVPYYPSSPQLAPAIQERCKMDIRYPTDHEGFATVIWFHGGSLKMGNKYFPEGLEAPNLCVVAVNYRLSPENTAPTYLRDAGAAVAYVFNNIEALGGDPNKIFISGHSAGAYLVSMIGLDKQYLGLHQVDANRVAGLIPLSGQVITHSTIREERGLDPNEVVIDEFAPIHHARKDAPPILLITGDRNLDLPNRYQENLDLEARMEAAGHTYTRVVELKGHNHNMVQPAVPLVLEEIRRVCARIDARR